VGKSSERRFDGRCFQMNFDSQMRRNEEEAQNQETIYKGTCPKQVVPKN
jgi:hypothetical protein